jgi:hypothetical protein
VSQVSHYSATKLLLSYDWPGNVRELRNAIERGMILEESALITSSSLPIAISLPSRSMRATGVPASAPQGPDSGRPPCLSRRRWRPPPKPWRSWMHAYNGGMQKWEYCMLSVSSDGNIALTDGGGGNRQVPATGPFHAMNVLGADHWEMVAVLDGPNIGEGDFTHNFYFKRPKA